MSESPDLQAQRAFQQELVEAGLLVRSGVPGVYARNGVFESIVDGLERLISIEGGWQQAEVLRFPPVFARKSYERLDHLANFPQLLGSVHSFEGGEAEHRAMLDDLAAHGDWARHLSPSETMLAPAACYPLYPSAQGVLPAQGRIIDLESFVYRHEPSDDPARMQSFRMREFVRMGTAEQAREHRDDWIGRIKRMLEALLLPVEAVVANDPFFGRGGRVMKATQREQDLKFELVVPICSEERPTAVASCNCHLDHFGTRFDIRTADGDAAHTACVGFGLERITLALLRIHGLNPVAWPASVRKALGIG